MNGWQDWNGLLGGINTGEDVCSFENTGEALMNLLRRQVVQVKVDVIILGANTASFEDFHSHGAGDDVSGCKILCVGGIPLHESLTLAIPEDSTFSTAALSHEAASAIDAGRMELYELGILNWESSSSDHTTTVTCACVRACAREVGAAVATCGHDRVSSLHPVDCAIGHVVGHDATAFAIFHEEIHRKVLHKEDAVVAKGTTEERVQHRVSGTVSDGTAAVGLATLAEVRGLTSEGSLVNLTFAGSAEGHAVRLELTHSNRSFSGHVLDGVLVTEPIGTFDGVIEVESPIVFVHVTERGVDSSLGGNSVRSGWEELGNAGGLEASLG